MDRLRQRANQRRVLMKPVFQDFDRLVFLNNGIDVLASVIGLFKDFDRRVFNWDRFVYFNDRTAWFVVFFVFLLFFFCGWGVKGL